MKKLASRFWKVFNAVASFNAGVMDADRQTNNLQMLELLKSLQSLGRFQEATHWAQMAMTSNPQLMMRMTSDSRFASEYRELISPTQTTDDSNPALKLDLKTFPEWRPPAGASELSGKRLEEKSSIQE